MNGEAFLMLDSSLDSLMILFQILEVMCVCVCSQLLKW